MLFLDKPKYVFVVCVFFGLLGTLFDGSLFRLWELKNNQQQTKLNIETTKLEILKLQKQISLANDPKFIEREARNRFDLVNDDDIVFVFSD